jgi:hypothetical protein
MANGSFCSSPSENHWPDKELFPVSKFDVDPMDLRNMQTVPVSPASFLHRNMAVRAELVVDIAIWSIR